MYSKRKNSLVSWIIRICLRERYRSAFLRIHAGGEERGGRLGAFLNKVDANERRSSGGVLTAEQADDLRTRAEDIMDRLDY